MCEETDFQGRTPVLLTIGICSTGLPEYPYLCNTSQGNLNEDILLNNLFGSKLNN